MSEPGDGGRSGRRFRPWHRFRNERDARSAEEVLAEERRRIEDDRPPELKGSGLWVLSHSGGGIRSASFAIGVQQALQADGLMGQFDYLSTVSGGGYAGAALTWGLANRDGHPPHNRFDEKHAAPHPDAPPMRPIDWEQDFPFGSDRVGAYGRGRRSNRFLDYLRHHGRYLTPGGGLGGLSFMGSVVQGTLIATTVYTLLAMSMMSLFDAGCVFSVLPECELSASHRVEQIIASRSAGGAPLTLAEIEARADLLGAREIAAAAEARKVAWWDRIEPLVDGLPIAVQELAFTGVNVFWEFVRRVPNFPTAVTLALLLVIGLLALTHSIATGMRSTGGWRYTWQRSNQAAVGTLWMFALASAWLAAVEGIGDFIIWDIVAWQNGYGWAWSAPVPVLAAAISALSGYARFGASQDAGPEKAASRWSGSLLGVGIVSGLFAVTVGAYVVTFLVEGLGTLTAAALLGGAGLLIGVWTNLNLVGPHGMYRSRLMEAFLPDAEAVREQRWTPATSANITTLMDIGCSHVRPLHLVNANLILTDSRRARYRGRGGDNFLLSPYFCGSTATGWFPTHVFNRSLFNRKGITLATAMAVSGAALNPDSGVGGNGPTRGRAASALLTLLNLRLGFWAPHPGREDARLAPNFITPGVRGGLMGRGLHEDAPFVQLSDGGHFENLALYEAIRRRAQVIVATDAGADPDFRFADLANLIQRTRVDFGACIEWRSDKNPRGVVADRQVGGLDFSVAERGWAVADIWYSEGSAWEAHTEGRPARPADGTLYYLKTTLIEDLPSDLVGYKKANDTFPDESTSDQFFSEAQFEAYRELGYQLAHRMVHEEDLKGVAAART